MIRSASLFRSPVLWTCAAAAVVGAGACAGVSGPKSNSSSVKTVELSQFRGDRKAAPAVPGKNVPAIKVNTVGYPTAWPKLAVFNLEPKGATLKDAGGKVVWTASEKDITDKGLDESSQDPVWQVDFSALKTPGEYHFELGEAKSDAFKIGDHLYQKAVDAGLKSFYFQRTRTALQLPYAEWEGSKFVRAKPSHVHENVGWDLEDYPAKKHKFKVEGGWHDAGNFDMYVPSTAPTAQALLMAYDWAPEKWKDKELNIPESGNGIPDILDETKWGLIWVLSMQVESGAFRHREAVMESSPEGPADQDMSDRWIAGVSSAGTAKAVGCLALAARVYEKWDKAFAQRCEKAAKAGWEFLQTHPQRILADGKGADQPLWDDEDDITDTGSKFVAAAEMWRTFRDKAALEQVKKLMKEPEATPEGLLDGAWGNLTRWGLATLALDKDTPKDVRDDADKKLLAAAELMTPRIEGKDGYRVAHEPKDYYWASNSNLMEKAHVIAVAARLHPEKKNLVEAVRDQWHWILGRNPNGYSMITRVGKGPDRLYHMEWGTMEPPPPGFLVGGPNAMEMGYLAPGAPAKAILWDNPRPLSSGLPPGSLWHWQQSDLWDSGFAADGDWKDGWWCVSEPDIYYSANFVLVGATLDL
jgi:endoglucanase